MGARIAAALACMNVGEFIAWRLEKDRRKLNYFLELCDCSQSHREEIRKIVEQKAAAPRRLMGIISAAASLAFQEDISFRSLLIMQEETNGHFRFKL